MADGFTVTFEVGPGELAHPNRASALITTALSNATRQGLFAWEAETVKRTPVGVSGALRSGYLSRIEVAKPLTITGTLTNVQGTYFDPVEHGAAPHWPPWGPGSDLALWAERKLGDASLAYVVARSIARGTTRGTAIRGVHMAEEALRVMRSPIIRLWQRAWREVSRKLNA